MKKIYLNVLFICGSLIFSSNAFAQGNAFTPQPANPLHPSKMEFNKASLYGRVYYGRGMPLSNTNIGTDTTITNAGTQTPVTNYEAVNGSYGKGNLIGFGIGYLCCKNVGLGLDLSSFNGSTYTTISSSTSATSSTTNKTETSLRGLKIRPAVTIFGPRYKSLAPFVEIGLTFSTEKMTWTNTRTTTGPLADETITEKKISPAFGVGGFAGMGAAWNFTKSIGIFAELQVQGQTFAPKHDVITKLMVNNQDKMSTLTTTSQKETEYVRTKNFLTAQDPGKPSEVLRANSNASALNILIGVSLNIGTAQRVTDK